MSKCELKKIDVICFDQEATAFATFQSHNQKIVSNENGIFLTYIRSRNEKYTAQNWRLLRSTDQGDTFHVIYDSIDPTNPAPLETDEENNLYLVYPDFVKWNSCFMIFKASEKYKNPFCITIPNTAGGKFAMAYDKKRRMLYYIPNNGDFHAIDVEGNIKYSAKIVEIGKTASFEYPHMVMDENGVLHVAWTTNMHKTFHYLSIYYMKSEDGGYTWKRMDGTEIRLPVLSDTDGGGDRITLDEEFDLNTWLSNFIAVNGKLHFMYRASPHPDFKLPKDDFYNGKQHYIRYDIARGKKDHEILAHELGGNKVRLAGFDGFFAVDRRPGKEALYYVAKQRKRIGCIVSYDNGLTWEDYALSEELVDDPYSIYATGGCREVSRDGLILGSFTERCGEYMDPFVKSRAHFIRIRC
ncbi:MAG: BNR-4 repeat-containing protein [Firmicutes bacterium]|nr:BNR-4 repeat-containing protein [Bacillota bacterium]